MLLVSRAHQEWYTPDHVITLAHDLFAPGGIDLDPSSTPEANARLHAHTFFTAADDGLRDDRAWSGNVFLNPPYGMRNGQSLQGLFVQRCISEGVPRGPRGASPHAAEGRCGLCMVQGCVRVSALLAG